MSTLSQNINQAISDFADIKTAIAAKGVTIPANTPTSQYDTLIESIPTGGGTVLETLKKLIERPSNCEIVIPDGVTSISNETFHGFSNLKTITIPASVETIESDAFTNCNSLTTAYVNSKSTGDLMFGSPCNSLTTIILGNTVTMLRDRLAGGINSLTTVHFPNSITRILGDTFYNCPNLTNITIESGFNANGLNLSVSTQYSASTIVSWLNALADRTGETAYTLTIGSTNLAKLTTQEIAIATNKNWNLA